MAKRSAGATALEKKVKPQDTTYTITFEGDTDIPTSAADDLKQKFEKEMGQKEKKLFDYWPADFRWTCCGSPAQSGDPESEDISFGCDYHGSGSTKCSCDFCQ